MSDTRQHVHELIDQLPLTQLSAVAGLLEVRNVENISIFVGLGVVGQRPPGNQRGVILAVCGMGHAHGTEDVVRGKIAQCFAAYAFHDDRKQEESSVAV